MFWIKKKATQYEINIIQAQEQLMSGDETRLKLVFEAFGTENKELVRKSGNAIGQYISKRTTKQMIRIGEKFREFTSLDWTIDWKSIDLSLKENWFMTESDYKHVLVLGTFHPNGYFRERCMELLEKYPESLVFLMLRTNDWVESIREKACTLVINKLNHCLLTEMVSAVQALEKLRYSQRRDENYFICIERLLYENMEIALKQIPLEKIHLCEFDARKHIYKILISRKTLSYEQIDILLGYEKHVFCVQILITGILENYYCSIERVDSYLKNKNGIVRRKALEYKYKMINNTWCGLENMLLDENLGVRDMVEFILRRHTDLSILDYYIEHLKDKNPIPAILGIGENGGKEEGKLLLPFLETESNKTVCATLEMMGRTLGMDGYDIYLKYLQHKELSLAKSAKKAIQSAGIRYGAKCLYDICNNTQYLHVKKYSLLLLLQENSWNRLPYLLMLYGREDLQLYEKRIWYGIFQRDMYGSISKEHAIFISRILQDKEYFFSKELIKNILFDMKFVVKE